MAALDFALLRLMKGDKLEVRLLLLRTAAFVTTESWKTECLLLTFEAAETFMRTKP